MNYEHSEGFCRVLEHGGIFEENDIAQYKYNRTILMNLHNKKLTSIAPRKRQELTFGDLQKVNLGYGYAISLINTLPHEKFYVPAQESDIIQIFCKLDNIVRGMNWRTGSIGYFSLRNCVFISHAILHKHEIVDGQLFNVDLKKLKRECSQLMLSSFKSLPVPLYKQEQCARRIQRVFRRWKSIRKIKGALKRLVEYINLEKEFYASELKYINYLRLIVDMYLVPLRNLEGSCDEILNKKEIYQIFGNIEAILRLNEEFYKDLQKAKQTGEKHLADVILGFLPFLKLYIIFIGQYENSAKLIKSYSNSNSRFKAILTNGVGHERSQEKNNSKSQPLGLTDLMPKPLQRIFAYNNMLHRMAEILPQEARPYSIIMKAKVEMEKHIIWVNETKRNLEHQQQNNKLSASKILKKNKSKKIKKNDKR